MFSTAWIEAAQAWSTPALDAVFRLFSDLGDVNGFTILLAFIYLGVDRRVGYLLMVAIVATNTLNLALKGLFDFPRPPEHLHKVSVAHYEPPRSLAFPSGHAQSAGTAWPILAVRFPYLWFWVVVSFVALMITVSRVFLGVHYVGDIVAGTAVGLLVAATALVAQPWIHTRTARLGVSYQLALAAGAPLLFLLLDQSNLTLFFTGAVSGLGVAYYLEPRLISPQRATNLVAFAGGLAIFFGADTLLRLIPGPPVWYLVRGFAVLFLVALAGPWLGLKWRQRRLQSTTELSSTATPTDRSGE